MVNFHVNDEVLLKNDSSLFNSRSAKYAGKVMIIRAVEDGRYILKVKNGTASENRELLRERFNSSQFQLNPLEVRTVVVDEDNIEIQAKNYEGKWVAILKIEEGEMRRRCDLQKLGFNGLSLDTVGRLRLAKNG